MRWLGLVVLSLSLFWACGDRELICRSPSDCVGPTGDLGLCVTSRCAFRDPNCASMYRYDDSAGSLAKMCVPLEAIRADAGVVDARPSD